MLPRPPRSTLFPYTTALPISRGPRRRRNDLEGRLAGPGAAQRQRAGTVERRCEIHAPVDRKSTRLNSSHTVISYAVFCLKKKKKKKKKRKKNKKTKTIKTT